MNKRQADWIVKKLCPFILREQGRGFGMNGWLTLKIRPGAIHNRDGLDRKAPSCGTIACIGGSIQFLNGSGGDDFCESAGADIGLDSSRSRNLFYGWCNLGWPRRFRDRYAKAKTALSKARVAVSLLKLVAKTRGKCLDTKP